MSFAVDLKEAEQYALELQGDPPILGYSDMCVVLLGAEVRRLLAEREVLCAAWKAMQLPPDAPNFTTAPFCRLERMLGGKP